METKTNWNIFKKILIHIFFIRHYKEQKFLNILNVFFTVLFILWFLKSWEKWVIIFIIVFRWILELMSFWAYKFVHSNDERIDSNWNIVKPKNGKWWLLTFLWMIWIIVSLFLPIISIWDTHISILDFMNKLKPYEVWGDIRSFVWFSLLSAISVFIWYLNRWKLLSLIWGIWIFFYTKMIFSVILWYQNNANLFKLLDYWYQYWIITNGDIWNALSSSPWVVLYFISSLLLIIACVKILQGYLELYEWKVN